MSIRSLFYKLGRSLRLKSADLDRIDEAHHNSGDTERALQNVLLLWLNQSYNVGKFGPPTWRMLVEAVDKKTGGNDQKLANEIAVRHPAGETFIYKSRDENGHCM